MKIRILNVLLRLALFFGLIHPSSIQIIQGKVRVPDSPTKRKRRMQIHLDPLNKGGMTMFKHWRENILSVATGLSLAVVIFMTAMGPAAAYAAINSVNNVAGGSNTLTGSGNVTVNAAALQLVKQVYTTGGSCLASAPADPACNSSATTATVPSGTTIKFLIFVKNTADIILTDIRFNDVLDTSGTGFTYVAASIRRTETATPPADTAAAATIFGDANGVSGIALTDALDTDVAGSSAGTISAGGPGGAGNNAALAINAHQSFGIIFQATKN